MTTNRQLVCKLFHFSAAEVFLAEFVIPDFGCFVRSLASGKFRWRVSGKFKWHVSGKSELRRSVNLKPRLSGRPQSASVRETTVRICLEDPTTRSSVKPRLLPDKLFILSNLSVKPCLFTDKLWILGQPISVISRYVHSAHGTLFLLRDSSVNATHHMRYLLMSSPRLWASRISVEEISTIGASRSWM